MSFDKRAKDWDKLPRRVKNALNIAQVIKNEIDLKNKTIIDIGVGTGLLSKYLVDDSNYLIGIDNSIGMIEEFLDKDLCKKEAILLDLNKDKIDICADVVVSSMTFHHLKDIKAIFKNIYDILNKNGFICIADLDKEDGSFHSDNTGVLHFGFDFNELKDILESLNFKDIKIRSCGYIKKHKNFEIKIIIAKKE